jgi:hypothetical protein
MTTQANFYEQVMDTMEALSDQINALMTFSSLLTGCQHHDVSLSQLSYLLDPIIEKQKALVEVLMNFENIVHSSPEPMHKSSPVLVVDNK